MLQALGAVKQLFRVDDTLASHLLDILQPNDVEVVAGMALTKLSQSGAFQQAEVTGCRASILAYIARREEQARTRHATPTQTFHSGAVLPEVLRFGSYLYYKRVISREMLEQALAWQKGHRPLTGQIAVHWGYMSPRQFAQTLDKMDPDESFGSIAVTQGTLTDTQVQTILAAQRSYKCQIGQFFIEQGLLTPEQVEALYLDMCEHNWKYAA